MWNWRPSLGAGGERRAADFLKRQGYRIVARNWRHQLGEVDVIARDGTELVFVEVRTRSGATMGTPEDSVADDKQRRLARLAEAYVVQSGYEGDWRIDVVAIDHNGIRHLKNAVSLW